MLTIRVKQQCSCGRCEAWAIGNESIHVQADNRADALRQIADKL